MRLFRLRLVVAFHAISIRARGLRDAYFHIGLEIVHISILDISLFCIIAAGDVVQTGHEDVVAVFVVELLWSILSKASWIIKNEEKDNSHDNNRQDPTHNAPNDDGIRS